ncbi:AAA family ATPase [Pyrobaculum sp.]|uniref:AAA family ATPase n=1 Tax=Pyrobaculum sp. TaxID=2004705 RepID=UPI003D0EBBC7
MIRRVELVNFKAHGKASIRFGEGVNFIYGPNGSGKTSIMEAVSVALFGSQWVKRVGGRWSDYLRRGATSGEVRLHLVHAGAELLVVRRFGEGGTVPSGTYLAVNGAVVARGDSDVTAALAARLGLGIEEYRQLLYIRQGELRRILQEAEYLDRVLRLDEFDKLDEVLREVLNELRARRERVGGRAEELEKRAQFLKTRVDALRRELAELEERLRGLESVKNQYAEVKERYAKLRERHASLAKEREALEKKLEELAQTSLDAEREIERLEAELGEIRRAREELRSLPQIGDVEKEYFELRQLVAAAERVPQEVRSYDPARLEEARRRAEDATRRLAEVRSRLELLRDVVRLAGRAEGGVCPVCGSPLRPEAVKRHELEVAGLEREERRLAELVEELRGEVKRLEALDKLYHANKDYVKVDLAAARRRLAELEKAYNEKREVEKRRAYLTALAEREGDVEKRLAEARRRLAEAEAKIGEVGERLREVEKEAEEVERELRETEATYSQLEEKFKEYNILSGRVDTLRRQLEEAERELGSIAGELEKAKTELAKLDGALGKAKNMRAALGEVKPMARQILLRAINEELNHVFLKLRHKESFKSAHLADSNGRYVVRVATPTGYIEHGLLSLGEQNLLALSLRVALARALLGGAPFMMFDEPTEHLDEHHRRKIVELIRELTSVVPTVIVTSHLGEFEEVADQVIQL